MRNTSLPGGSSVNGNFGGVSLYHELDYHISNFSLPMIINADFLLPHLREKVRLATRDATRHILCPACGRRTKLYRLRDDRRKCSVCGLKFSVGKKQGDTRLEHHAVLLVCFCLDFTAHKTAVITSLDYRLVADTFAVFRMLLAKSDPLHRDRTVPQLVYHLDDISACAVCRKLSKKSLKTLLIGVRNKDGRIVLERFFVKRSRKSEGARRVYGDISLLYGGFIHHGTFHTFRSGIPTRHDGLAFFWAWADERLRVHHGISPDNTWYYLKELEWKYNHRHLKPQMQAMRMVLLLPLKFLQGEGMVEFAG